MFCMGIIQLFCMTNAKCLALYNKYKISYFVWQMPYFLFCMTTAMFIISYGNCVISCFVWQMQYFLFCMAIA